MQPIKDISKAFSLDELLSDGDIKNIVGEINEIEVENKDSILDQALVLYTKDLIPNKVDAVTRFVEYEKNAIENDKEYVKELRTNIYAREKTLEKIKSFFAGVLFKHGFNTENRLSGNANSIWYGETIAFNPEANIDMIPNSYKTFVIEIPWEGMKELKELGIPFNHKETIVKKTELKKAIEEDIVENDGFYIINRHFKTGKSNKGKRK